MLIFYSALQDDPDGALRGRGARRRRRVPHHLAHQAAGDPRRARHRHDLLGHRQLPALQRAEHPADARPERRSRTYFTPNMYAYNLSFAGQQFNYAADDRDHHGRHHRRHRLRRPAARHEKEARAMTATEHPLQRRRAAHQPHAPPGSARAGAPPRRSPRATQVRRAHDPDGAARVYASCRWSGCVVNSTKTQRTCSRLVRPLVLAATSLSSTTSSQTLTYDDGIFVRWFGNTLLYVVVGAGGATLLATLAGYGLAKFDFPGKRAVFAIVLGAMAVPGTALAVPTFLMFSQMGLTNTPWAVIIPSLISAVRALPRVGLRGRRGPDRDSSRRRESTGPARSAPSSRSRSACSRPASSRCCCSRSSRPGTTTSCR